MVHASMKRIKKQFNKKIFALLASYIVLLIPIIIAGIYDFPQGDDWSYSWQPHLAYVHTGSVWQALRMSIEDLKYSYMNWQGTFASLIFMTLQPGVWKEELYHLVPIIMLVLISGSVLSLCKVVLKDKGDGASWFVIGIIALFFIIEKMPGIAAGIYWYNAAIHYMGMLSFFLFMIAAIIHSLQLNQQESGKQGVIAYTVLASILAVVVGGGNLITGLFAVVAFVSALALCMIIRKWHKFFLIFIPAICNFIAFGINVLAPGNAIRQASNETYGIISTIQHSFHYCLTVAFGEWIDWSVVLMILAIIPIAFRTVNNMEYRFPLPGLVGFYSYCLLATTFAPSYYTDGYYDVSRVLNVTYAIFILLVIFNVFYFCGWVQKHVFDSVTEKNLLIGQHEICDNTDRSEEYRIKTKQMYCVTIVVLAMWGFLICGCTNPESFTTTQVMYELYKGTAREYGENAAKNIEILRSDDPVVTIVEMPGHSEIFSTDEMEHWGAGVKAYYEKEEVNILVE